MRNVIDTLISFSKRAIVRASASAGRRDRRTLAWAAIALAGLIFLSLNLIASTTLRSWKADVTKEGLYTISEGTRRALAAIDEPIDIRVYYSRRLGESAPNIAKSFERVRALLEQYRAISGNRLRIAYLDPEPFSDAEDRAVAAGMRGVRLNSDGDAGYFGLAGTNSTDQEQTIAFFSPERERFIEYDVTRLVHSLASPKKRIVGLLSSLPLDGGLDPMLGMRGRPQPPQLVMEQIRDSFEVKSVETSAKAIGPGIDVLMIVQPENLPAETVYAIDQFALRGGKILAFLDPVAESQRAPPGMPPGEKKLGEFAKLLAAWGVKYDPAKVAGDMAHARRVQFSGGSRPLITEYVAWLALDRRNLDQRDVLSGSIERLNLGTPGFLASVDGATTTLQPILQTSREATEIAAEKVTGMPDPVALVRGYKAGGTPLVLAARLSGEIRSAFPEGAPKPAEKEKAGDDSKAAPPPAVATAAKADAAPSAPHLVAGRINAVLVADTDILADHFWVDVRELLGQQVAVPYAQNAAFVVGALENLSGAEALLTLRGRGITDRPFEVVDRIRRGAEREYREKEQALTVKLKEIQEKIAKAEKASDGDQIVLSDKDRQSIETLRGELLGTRRELREVKRELRRDIDRLDGWLKFLNIAAVPLAIGIAGAGWSLLRRRRAPANA